jgi:L,D-transpeptidase YcbB
VLTGDKDEGVDKINEAVATNQTQRLELDDAFPVYLVYWTAIAAPDGTAGFRPDIYDRDKTLLAKLNAKAPVIQVAPAPQAASPLAAPPPDAPPPDVPAVDARPISSKSLSKK